MRIKTCRTALAYIAAVIVMIVAMPARTVAQETPYKFDFGAGIGMSGYQGEAAKTLFSHPSDTSPPHDGPFAEP